MKWKIVGQALLHKYCKLFLLSIACAFFSSTAYGYEPYFDFGFGAGVSKVGKSQNYSPVNGLVNYYSLKSENKKFIGPLLEAVFIKE